MTGPVEGAGTDAAASVARRPPALLWWAVGLLAGFVLLAALVALNPASPFTQPLDDWWRGVIGVGPDSGAYTWFLPMFFQHLGEAPGWIASLVVLLVLAVVGRWRTALFFLSAMLLSTAFSQAVKNLVDRPRPAADPALGLYGPLFDVDHGSHPSGHAVTVAALVVAVAAVIPAARAVARRVWWIVGALLMAGIVWQRTLINAHWLTDTLAGLVTGACAALLMWWAFWPWLRKDYGRPVWFVPARSTPATA